MKNGNKYMIIQVLPCINDFISLCIIYDFLLLGDSEAILYNNYIFSYIRIQLFYLRDEV